MESNLQFTNEQISPEGLPRVEELQYETLSKNYFWSKLIGASISYVILFTMSYIIYLVQGDFLGEYTERIILVALFLWIVWGVIRIYKTYQKKAYAIRQKDIVYKSGWIWKKLTTIPFNRIQHCELNSGPIDRAFDLTELQIFTAGGSSSDLTIPGLSLKQGAQLKQFILTKIGLKDEEE